MKWFNFGLFVFILFALVLTAGCGDNKVKVSEIVSEGCGDKICQDYENCNCIDCKDRKDCKKDEEEVKVLKGKCDDGNECTKDIFNEVSKICSYEKIEGCCGNDICESGERCNEETHTTVCIEDCKAQCEPFVIIYDKKDNRINQKESFTCGDENCIEVSSNEFKITGNSSITTTLENTGEKSTDIVTSNFKCVGEEFKALKNFENILGVTFSSYFNDKLGSLNGINSKISGNNYATYKLQIDPSKLKRDNLEVICDVKIIVNPVFDNLQFIKLSIE